MVTLTDTQTQSGSKKYLDPDILITTFDFTGQTGVSQLSSISSIEITLTAYQGDSDVGEFDYENLVLVLDNIDTGIELNGFTGGILVTETNSGVPTNDGSIASALKSDGTLVAQIRDMDLADANWIYLSEDYEATLTITGTTAVPVPQAAPLGFALLGAAGLFRLIRKRRKQF